MTGDANEQSVDGRPFAGFPVQGMDDPAALADPRRIGAEIADEPALERVGGGFIDLRDARSVQYPAARAEHTVNASATHTTFTGSPPHTSSYRNLFYAPRFH